MAVAVSRRPVDVETVLARIDNPRDACMLALMGHMGLAPGDVHNLDVEDLGLTAGRLYIHGRHGTSRCLTLCAAVRPYLDGYLARRSPTSARALFLSTDHPPARLSLRRIRGLTRESGVKAFDLRHSWVQQQLGEGKDPRQLRDDLGLQSIDAVYQSIEPRPARRTRWHPKALRRWALEVLEEQLETWHLRNLRQVPPSFRWPPLPAEDLAALEAAAPSIARLIAVILDDLLVRRPRPASSTNTPEFETGRQVCLATDR